MTGAASVAKLSHVDSENLGTGARIRARRKALGLKAGRLAELAVVNPQHLSAIENGHKEPTEEWARRVERAMDVYARETGQDEPASAPAVTPPMIRFTVEGVHGAKALVVEGPVENIAELEAAVDKIMRRLAGEKSPTTE